jgi:hypothetical protein
MVREYPYELLVKLTRRIMNRHRISGGDMFVNWDDMKNLLSPLKDYEDLCRRFQVSFSYPFVLQSFNFTLIDMIDYTHKLLGADSRGRYTEYETLLVRDFCRAPRRRSKRDPEFTGWTSSVKISKCFAAIWN